MSEQTGQDDMSKKVVVYRMPGMDAVTVRQDVKYETTDAGDLTMDIYYPPDSGRGAGKGKARKGGARTPAVILVSGYGDEGMQSVMGCKFKDMGSSVSWARLAAASGLAAITYTNRDPATDVHTVIQYVRDNAAALGIDENRIGVWASSGNVPNALSVVMRDGGDRLKCALLCYGFMLDVDGSSAVAEAAKTFGFVNPCAGKSVDDLPRDLPLFVVRAGRDTFGALNETIDVFVAGALGRNLPITLVNYAEGPHAFDLMDDSDGAREVIKQVLAFMRSHLLV